ncbi:MAG: glucosaminidase domain-containing protein [Acidimicrobiia bacterium]
MLRTRLLSATAIAGLSIAALGCQPALTSSANDPKGLPVLGPSRVTAAQLTAWFNATGKTAKLSPGVSIADLATYFIEEGNAEHVRGDMAFVQSILETGYFQYDPPPPNGFIVPSDNNFAGMGAYGDGSRVMRAPDARTGVRAQIQHLRNFADPTSRAANLAYPPVPVWYGADPAKAVSNYDNFSRKGKAPTWNQLGGADSEGKVNWAADATYATKIANLYNRILTFSGLPGDCPPDDLNFSGRYARGCPVAQRQPGRSIAINPNGGYYILNGDGTVTAKGGAVAYGNDIFTKDIARDMAVMPDGLGYVVLDAYGGVHRFGSALALPVVGSDGYWPGWDIARSIAITPDGKGTLMLDGFGGVHKAGTAATGPLSTLGSPYWKDWDIARSVAVMPDGLGYVVLDGLGSVHRAGSATALPPLPSPSPTAWAFDIARDVVLTSTGYYVLSGYGDVIAIGAVPKFANIGYATFDRWRGIAVVGTTLRAIRNDGTDVKPAVLP